YCDHDDFRALRSFFSVLDSLKLIIFPMFLYDGKIGPDLDIEGMIGAYVHTMLYHPIYPQTVRKLVKLDSLNPDSKPNLYFLNLLRTDFITCSIGFPSSNRKNQIPFFDYIFQVPEIVKGFGCYCNLPFPPLKGTLCNSHSFFTPPISIPSSLPPPDFFSIFSS